MIRFTVLFILLFVSCSRSHSKSKSESRSANPPGQNKQVVSAGMNPKDFVVPPIACDEYGFEQFGGALLFESEPFENWLSRTGAFGELVALNDTRDIELASATDLKNFKPSGFSHRICDLAYQMIFYKYTDVTLSYLDDLDERDKKIKRLIELIKSKNGDKHR